MANSQTFTLNIKAVADMKDVQTNIQNIQKALSQLKLPADTQNSFKKTFSELEKELDKYQKIMAGGIKTKNDASSLEKSGNNIIRLYDKVVETINSIDNSALKKAFEDIGAKEVENLKQQLEQVQNTLKTAVSQSAGDGFTNLKNSLKELSAACKTTSKDSVDLGKELSKIGSSTLNTFINNLSNGRFDLAQKNFDKLKERITEVKNALNDAGDTENSGKLEAWLTNLETAFNKLKTDGNIQPLIEQVNQLKGSLKSSEATVIQKLIQQFNEGKISAEQLQGEMTGIITKTNEWGHAQAQTNKELDQVKSRIQYFLGLNNIINLTKRAIRGAVQTIKDLDKAMTETAVVTDFTVGDMWKQLPEYTKRANELGVTTQAAYEAATLYYQQGLNTEEVNALSVETLKMARIAGLDAAEATDRMTNALRGFNMELNTANAQRVDDVYSELAANTASNVDEISTAMTKVASLAHSANMEFETTAAFLAQIIETTRESAETAGTALKTVVARFSEVKKLVDTNQLRGQDEEGQVVDVNRVSSALRTAGIDLNKYFLGEVGLDDIFMELASKWDSLTSVQQRYIATQAAGSRQQSRFIALMQDYARTQELVGKAYNAEGASARQFEKTQESLESKLNRLKNAWNEFLMGLTNNVMVKTFVDLLTDLLNLVNKLTSAFGDGVGSILKWTVALGGLAGLRTLFADGGLASKAIGKVFSNTIIGNVLGKVLGIKMGTEEAPTSPGGQPGSPAPKGKDLTFFGSVGSLGKKAWSGFQTLGTKAGLSGGLLGKAAGGLNAGIMSLGGSANLAMGLTGVATALGAVAAAVGIVVAGYQAWLRLTPEGQLKQAKQLATVMNTVATNTEKNAAEFKKATENYKTYDNAVKTASNTAEYQKALSDRTNYVSELLKNNPNIAQYVKAASENGQVTLTINEKDLEEATQKAADTATQAAISADFTNALVAGKQANVYQSQLNGKGVSGNTIFDPTAENERRELTADERIRYSPIQQQLAEAQAKQVAYAQQAFAKQLENSELSDEVANLLSNALAQGFDADKYLSEINAQRATNWWRSTDKNGVVGVGGTRKELEAAYLNLYGQQADSSMKRADLARAVAEAQVNQREQERTNAIAEAVKGGEYNDILKAIAGEIDFSAETDEAKQKLQEFADIIGEDITVVEKQIDQGQKARAQIKKNRQTNVYDRLLRSGAANEQQTRSTQTGKNITYDTAVDQYSRFLESLDAEGLAAVDAITAQAETLLGDKLAGFMTELPKLYNSVDFQSVQNLFNKIDLDNPIQAYAELQKYAEDTTSAVGRYANAIKDANKELFTSSNLVKSFVASAEYDNITASLEKFIEENEAITADNINELAESCSDLAILINEDVASAEALAEAFTLLESGKLTFDQITDALLKALDAGKGFETVIAEVKGWVEDFDQGNDLKEGADHVVQVLEDLKGYVENWEFGNEPVENIYDHLFGEGKYQEYLSSFKNGFDPEEAERYITEQIERFTQLFENQGLGAIQELSGNIPGLTSLGNNLFNWDLSAIGSTKEAIKQVADSLEITEEAAESLILAWQTHIPGLRTEWNNLAFGEQVQAFTENLGTAKVITEQELEALAASTGHTVDEIKAKLRELALEGNIKIPIIVNWQDENGRDLTGNNLYANFVQRFGNFDSKSISYKINWGAELADAVVKGFNDEIIGYDPTQVLSYFTERGLNTEQATEMANKAISDIKGKFTKEIEIPVTYKEVTEDNKEIYKTETKTITVEADTVEGLDAAVNTALEAANYESVATAIASQDFSGLSDNIKKAGAEGGRQAAAEIQTVVNSISPEIVIKWKWDPDQGAPTVPGSGGASGGVVQSFASGSANNSLSPGMALTGEEGPEIVWNKKKGYAYITGEDHPEFQNLQPGDRVFNAQETKKILNGAATGGEVPSYAKGGWKPGSGSGSGGGKGGSGGSGGKDKEDEWKNDLDWLYNLMEDIVELERDQKALEEQYEDYLEDQSKTGQDLYKLLIKQLGNLYTQLQHQQFALEKREQEMREFMDVTNDKDQYLWYNWQDRTIEIDWDAIDQITDEDEYKHVKELINEAEEIQDKIDDADDSIMDITNQIQELEHIWRDTYVDFEKRVLDALVKSYQKVIDNYSELNDTLNDSNSQILQSLQKEIDLQRQIRDNTKTEEQIADDEARLAYLRRDTSGGNDLDALQLEKDLNDQRENYTDTLIDQAIQRLQDDNDAAAQQRERQIEIMQAQLDYQSENGEFNAFIRQLMEDAISPDGQLLTDSELYNLLKTQENWDAMSDVNKQVWEEELTGTFKQVAAFLLKQNAEENGTFYTALTNAIEGVSSAIGSYSQAMVKIGTSYTGAGGPSSGGSSSGGPQKEPQSDVVKNAGYNLGTTMARAEQLLLKKPSRKYATGGLADTTGLAWLDGTPQEPEYVLNARQTDAFLKLADVLPSVMGNNSSSDVNNTFGATTFNLSVNIDKIASDYDVDHMCDLIKEKLYDSGSYRNVNSLSFIR